MINPLHDLEQEIIDLLKEEIKELKGWSYNGKATFEERLVWLVVESKRVHELAYAWLHIYTNAERLHKSGKEISS